MNKTCAMFEQVFRNMTFKSEEPRKVDRVYKVCITFSRFTKKKSLQRTSKALEGDSKMKHHLSRSLRKYGFHPRSLEKLDSI